MNSQKQLTINFDKDFEKIKDSTATVEELRVAMFSPVEKFSHNSNAVKQLKENKFVLRKTNWGEMKLEKVLLSQVHRDLLDCVLTYGEPVKKQDHTGNRIGYVFSANEILSKYYGGNSKSRNTKFIEDKLTDMMASVISLKLNNGNFFKFQILSSVGYEKSLGKYYMEFNPKYIEFLSSSLSINYSNELPKLINIGDPLIKAIIRFSFTHKDKISLKVYDPNAEYGKRGILEAIGYPTESKSSITEAYKKLDEYRDVLKDFGIIFNLDRKTYKYERKNDIELSFIPPVRKVDSKIIDVQVDINETPENLIKFIGKTIDYKSKFFIIDTITTENDEINIMLYETNDNNKKLKRLPFKMSSPQLEELLRKILVI